MDDKTINLLIAITIVVGLFVVCNSKHPINIKIQIKGLNVEIGTKKEDK